MKITVEKIRAMKGRERISMLTAYDYSTAKVMDQAGIDIVLIGDSLGMVVLGFDTTQKVTMQDMIRHTGAVARGIKNSHIVADMPYKSYDNEKDALKNAKLLLEAGADSVKTEKKPEIAGFLVKNGINDMLGLFTDFKPKFVKRYAELSSIMKKAVEDYNKGIKERKFPDDEHSFH